MFKKIAALTASLFLFVATSAFAKEAHWAGPGWYGNADTGEGACFISGPFADKESCMPTLPPDDDKAIYFCNYFKDKPNWD